MTCFLDSYLYTVATANKITPSIELHSIYELDLWVPLQNYLTMIMMVYLKVHLLKSSEIRRKGDFSFREAA